jgi:hypothetical protein
LSQSLSKSFGSATPQPLHETQQFQFEEFELNSLESTETTGLFHARQIAPPIGELFPMNVQFVMVVGVDVK